jgi:hypothetical protein
MLKISPPMSNAERQRKFQRAHPGYDARRKGRQRSGIKRYLAWQKVQAQLAALAQQAQMTAETIQVPAIKPMLMLPAPVENPLMAEIAAFVAARKAQPVESPFVSVSSQSPAARAL